MKYSELKQAHFFQIRLLEIIPGAIIWVLLLSPFWIQLTSPEFIFVFYSIVSLVWIYRALVLTIGTVAGYLALIRNTGKEWLLHLEQLPLNRNQWPQHLVVYPVANTNLSTLHKTLLSLYRQNYPREKIFVVVAIEQKAIDQAPNMIQDLNNLIAKSFPIWQDNHLVTLHPKTNDEKPGAAANRTWGARHGREWLIEKGLDPIKFVITSPDEDIILDRNYIPELSYKYLVTKNADKKFYQTAQYKLDNNHWQVPILVRVLNLSLALPIMAASIVEHRRRETFSCYSLNLELLHEVGYWDTSVSIDDTLFYWRPFAKFSGKHWESEVLFSQISADAVYNPNYLQNHLDQYKQYVRWGWGALSFPIGMSVMWNRQNKVGLLKKLVKSWQLIEMFAIFKVIPYLVLVTPGILILTNPDLAGRGLVAAALSLNLQTLGVSFLLSLPLVPIRILLTPHKPNNLSLVRYFLSILAEMPLGLISLLTFSTIPFVDAATRMMFGKTPEFKSTKKYS